MRSVRRGRGSEVAGTRPYPRATRSARSTGPPRRGSPPPAARTSSSSASATPTRGRASSSSATAARGSRFYEPPLPWLDKGAAMRYDGRASCSRAARRRAASSATSTSRTASRTGCRRAASAGSRRFARSGSTRRLGRAARRRRALARASLPAPPHVTAGSFVFVLSDFLDPPRRETWLTAVEHLWDVIPVVIQDPIWEQSFPDVSGIAVPFRDPAPGASRTSG